MGDWIVRQQPLERPALRLFLFPYAGAGTAPFAGWHRRVPEEIDVATVRLPGRETRMREAPYRRVEPLVDDLAGALAPLFDVPFAFFGHSLGAILAFELTLRLRRAGGALPVHLFVSARRAPQLPERDPPVSHLPDDAFVAEMVRRYDAVPPMIRDDADLLRFFLPLLRADVALLEAYRFAAADDPLPVPITALGGSDDARVPAGDLEAWCTQTAGPFGLRLVPGGHFFVREAEGDVVGAVVAALGQATAPERTALSSAR